MAQCRHPDIQLFDGLRCCLSCGEAVFETADAAIDHPASPNYHYTPLKHTLGSEIRLLILYAGPPSSDLLCDLTVANLADRPAYEAVSYTWADGDGDRCMASSISCRGKCIPITRNCDAALRRLRLPSRSRRLWVDAICINQQDTAEKNYQVRLMASIYTKASQVLAYLGVGERQVSSGLARVVRYLQDEQAVADEAGVKAGLAQLFGLAYFDRVWVLQEVGLSQLVTLIIGAAEIRWTGAAIAKTLNLSAAFGIQAPSILSWNPASRPEEEGDVLAVLSKSRNCSATDPRDKVYALLGLMHPDFSAQFGIDYSLSYPEVFIKVARILADAETDSNTHTDNISLSTAAWRQRIQHTELPPTREPLSPADTEYLTHLISAQQNQNLTHKILSRSTSPPAASPNLPYLQLRAHRLGTITRALGEISDARRFYVPHRDWPALGSRLCARCHDAALGSFGDGGLKAERTALNYAIEIYGAGKVAFTTSHSVGFARAPVQAGDEVWVLYGADVPFILREVDGHYGLMGDCYLHRAGQPFPCKNCGADRAPWPMQTEVIDLW
ncbi:heterokaryon incompatibility protein-domain-containing protein [Boeremia exigua]|uniref:heterokaryon incompatibility protein-domain-containing protein n=1 Tax=Boeremia exigua TaxID=749465 RepID=UPI001E8E1D87|nr:heterokaryon incompatibility protein-domain-containing protein [Boeremia exigua]KAH6620421.1 heterokaryon incompatibility protein-domain-containing protein [Boeremia exigua]